VTAAFEFGTAGRVVFGWGEARRLPDLVTSIGQHPFVCTGHNSERFRSLIGELPGEPRLFTVAGEPTVDMVRLAVARAHAEKADVIVAIGGGSVIDLGKSVGILLGNGGDPLDYLEVIGRGAALTAHSVPVVAVPTTAGTGSEVTANAVLTAPEHRRKVSLRSRHMLPAVALVDPELTVGCPASVTASSGLDALTQCLEPFVSPLANPITDSLTRAGLQRAATGLRQAYADGSDRAARTDMSTCSLFGGMALANAKLGAVHGFAGVIGGMVDAPHGAVCATLLAPVVEANLAALAPGQPALDRYAEAARLLTGRPRATAADGVAWIRETVRLLEVPTLSTLGVRPEDVENIVAMTAGASSTKGNPVVLTADQLTAALLAALG
jgi:alcohol dehydrogenase class IV